MHRLESLYRLCLRTLSDLLKSDVYKKSFRTLNPFCFLPSNIVEELIALLTSNGDYSADSLNFLLDSGRVVNFALTTVMQRPEELPNILDILSTSCENLKSLTLQMWRRKRPHRDSELALERLLSNAVNLESIDSHVTFDLTLVRGRAKIKVLKTKFRLRNHLQDLLEMENGKYLTNYSLHTIESNQNDLQGIKAVLQHCKELTYFHEDISTALEDLHWTELMNSNLTPRYKLKMIFLGCYTRDPTLEAISIAAVTCPLVEEINFVSKKHETIPPLSKFKNLKRLWISWPDVSYVANAHHGLHPMLQSVGPNLTELNISYFLDLDITLIAQSCPMLEYLNICNCEDMVFSQCTPRNLLNNTICFQNLKHLLLNQMLDSNQRYSEELVVFLLSNSPRLEILQVLDVKSFNDHTLNQILKQNRLPELKWSVLRGCGLTHKGLECFLSSAMQLECFFCESQIITINEVKQCAHQLNPFLNVSESWLLNSLGTLQPFYSRIKLYRPSLCLA